MFWVKFCAEMEGHYFDAILKFLYCAYLYFCVKTLYVYYAAYVIKETRVRLVENGHGDRNGNISVSCHFLAAMTNTQRYDMQTIILRSLENWQIASAHLDYNKQ